MAKKKTSHGQEDDLLRIASFMLFDAMLFHIVLSNGRHDVRPFSVRGKAPWKSFLRDEWQHIRSDINYTPVFNLAIDIIDSLPVSPDTEAILEGLSDAATNAVTSGILLKHDFLGRIYHRLLLSTTGHYYATYYTSLPAAWLLGGLTLRHPHKRWKFGELGDIANFSVIDPACGSGTLLSAAYGALKDIYLTTTVGEFDLDTLHEVLLSDVIHGWDVLDFAAHLSLTTLALHHDRVTTNRSNILRMPLGAAGSRAQLGSLDRLQKALDLKGVSLTDSVEELDLEGTREVEVPHRTYDVVIMNPPFSRSAKPNKTFGYSEDAVRKRMQEELAALGKQLGLRKAGVAGLTPFFMCLGLEIANDDGRVGMVVPRSILSGVGSRDVRLRYEQDTAIRFVVSNFDPGSRSENVDGWSWSENTDIGEVLVVAEKASKSEIAISKVCFVNVFHRPRTEVESLILAQGISKALRQGVGELKDGAYTPIEALGRLYAAVYTVDQNSLGGNWLTGCTFATPELNYIVHKISTMKNTVPLTSVLKIVDREHATGRDIAPIKQHFEPYPGKSDGRMVWGHQATMNQIKMSPEHVKNARGLKPQKSKLMFNKFGAEVLLAERPHMKTEALLAMRAPEKVLATAFWELQFAGDADANWFLLWMNSTYGIMSFLSCSTSSQADIFKMKKDQIALMRIPARPSAVTAASLSGMIDQVAKEAFLPYTQEFERAAAKDGPRYLLDQFFKANLGLPDLDANLYSAIASDPVIARKKYGI